MTHDGSPGHLCIWVHKGTTTCVSFRNDAYMEHLIVHLSLHSMCKKNTLRRATASSTPTRCPARRWLMERCKFSFRLVPKLAGIPLKHPLCICFCSSSSSFTTARVRMFACPSTVIELHFCIKHWRLASKTSGDGVGFFRSGPLSPLLRKTNLQSWMQP